MTTRPITRRTLLRGAGVALALPVLDVAAHAADRQADDAKRTETGELAQRRRMVAICTYLGVHTPYLYPTKAGKDYDLTPYLEPMRDLRDEFTVFSGLSHPDVDGGHSSVSSFLTAAPHPGSSSFKNTISLDQFAAERLNADTRFGYLALSTNGGGISWTRSGIRIPADDRPSRVFARLFLAGSPDDVRRQMRRIHEGQSIMDVVRGEARQLRGTLGQRDQAKLDEYFSAVRDLETRLVRAEAWSKRPKPKVDYAPPKDVADKADFVGRLRLMLDMAYLALVTDSTRLITLSISGTNLVPPIQGVSADWHNLSHHGKDPQKLEQLKIVELEKMRLIGDFMSRLKSTKEGDATLLDKTMVLFGSNLGNASSHNTRNMPILLAGGGFKHGRHVAFDTAKHPPLCNLYVSMLQRLGLDVERFASATGPMAGLDLVG